MSRTTIEHTGTSTSDTPDMSAVGDVTAAASSDVTSDVPATSDVVGRR